MLHSSRLLGHLQVGVGLMQVGAHPEQHPARGHWGKIAFLQTVVVVQEVLYAVRLGPEAPPPEGINVNFAGAGLKTADEMAGKSDSGNGKFQPPADEEVNGAETNRVAVSAVHHAV